MCNRRVAYIYTEGFLNYLSVIVVFFKVVFKNKIVKFSKHFGTFTIEESGGVKVQIMEFQKDNNNNNCQIGLGKPRKFSKSRMTKRTALLNSSCKI